MRFLTCVFIMAFCCDAKYVPSDGVYSVADDMPVYEKGMDAFQHHISEYLAESKEHGSGSVFVSFIITKEGELKEVKVVKSLNTTLDKLAVNAIKTAPHNWKPGVDEGKAVNVEMVYPIHFSE